jgi:hypothetical protein
MSVEPLIHWGKYESAYYLQDEEMAKSYLRECVKDAVHGGIAENQALQVGNRKYSRFCEISLRCDDLAPD